MDLFFIVSGFVIVHSSAHLFGAPGARWLFLRRRLWRVVPLYWGVTFAYVAMQAARGNGYAIGMNHLAASLVFLPVPNSFGSVLPTYGIGWTLNYEMFFYACFAAALRLTYHRGLTLVAGAPGMLAVLNAMFDLPQPIRFWAHPVVLEFLLGIACAVLFREGVRLAPSAARLMVVVGLAALAGTSVLDIGFSPDAPD